jgi:hypothetical protein
MFRGPLAPTRAFKRGPISTQNSMSRIVDGIPIFSKKLLRSLKGQIRLGTLAAEIEHLEMSFVEQFPSKPIALQSHLQDLCGPSAAAPYAIELVLDLAATYSDDMRFTKLNLSKRVVIYEAKDYKADKARFG